MNNQPEPKSFIERWSEKTKGKPEVLIGYCAGAVALILVIISSIMLIIAASNVSKAAKSQIELNDYLKEHPVVSTTNNAIDLLDDIITAITQDNNGTQEQPAENSTESGDYSIDLNDLINIFSEITSDN